VKRVGSREVWGLPEVTAAIWRRFEDIPPVWVEAEICNLHPSSGQVYFTLRDDHTMDASMNPVVFSRLPFRPADGQLVQAYGRVEYWRARSIVRMRVERLEPAGQGLLLAQIEALKARLGAEGLLADARKRPLPFLPRRIGLVTSGSGAAREDVLRNLWARFPAASVVLIAAQVQGEAAPAEIVRALRYLDRLPDVDVIVVARGGGSLEDLMPFNSEVVARAVAASRTPVVSAVGHEKDVTLCDLVADRRVSTPTAAAEAVVPDARALGERLGTADAALARSLRRAAERARERLDARARGLGRALRERGARAGDRVDGLRGRLERGAARAAGRAPVELAAREARLRRATAERLTRAEGRLERNAALLATLSPARTVARGYAIVRDRPSGRVLTSAAAARPGQPLELELRDGRLPARVEGADR
jgi:exodeoxyribonuclease VII large subunit